MQMRIAWEKEAAADMAELKDLREKHKKMKTDLEDTKQQWVVAFAMASKFSWFAKTAI